MRIAIVGTGISGLGAAWMLGQRHEITVYEAEARAGGHSNTVDMPCADGLQPVDTGFIVYNDRNYPNLVRLFEALAVPTRPSNMSFGVSIDDGALEYAGDGIGALLAQPTNLIRPTFRRMLFEILRFNREALAWLGRGEGDDLTLGQFLDRGRYGEGLRQYYLLPMGAAIWSASLEGISAFPARSFLQFYANHGLLSLNDRPAWRTVEGGAKAYVDKIISGFPDRLRLACPVTQVRRIGEQVEVLDAGGGTERFDHVVLACHADQALRLIDAPTFAERSVLGSFRYQRNHAVLHRDASLMPKRKNVWSSWNYLARSGERNDVEVSVTYWMNRLQGIDPARLALVSLNPIREPEVGSVVAAFDYEHPQYDQTALAAQQRLAEIQGRERLWFCGANWGWGFHEDGLKSGLEVAAALDAPAPWWPARPFEIRRMAAAPTLPEAAAAHPIE